MASKLCLTDSQASFTFPPPPTATHAEGWSLFQPFISQSFFATCSVPPSPSHTNQIIFQSLQCNDQKSDHPRPQYFHLPSNISFFPSLSQAMFSKSRFCQMLRRFWVNGSFKWATARTLPALNYPTYTSCIHILWPTSKDKARCS